MALECFGNNIIGSPLIKLLPDRLYFNSLITTCLIIYNYINMVHIVHNLKLWIRLWMIKIKIIVLNQVLNFQI